MNQPTQNPDCTYCNGTGMHPKKKNKCCPVCKGSGLLQDDVII